MEVLPFSEVERIVHLLASAASTQCTLDERRSSFMAGLAELVDSDIWVWLHSRVRPGDLYPTPFHCLDGGWRDDSERSAFLNGLNDPETNRVVNGALIKSEHTTLVRNQFLPEDDPIRAPLLERWTRTTGMRECIVSIYPLTPETYSGVGLHRRAGKPAFTPAQRAMVHMILNKVCWLHKDGQDIPANDDRLLKLSPREREVLLYLLEGDSRKQIAIRLGLSHHTIADHMKSIYKQFTVNSRAELLAQFMRSGIPTFLPAK